MLLFVQVVYWFALATWFGSVLFLALAVPVIFSTVRESDPILPTVLSVNLEGQHATLLAGTIVGNLIERLTRIEFGCAALLLLGLIAQAALIRPMTPPNFVPLLIRAALFVAAVGLVLYHGRVLWPRIAAKRQQFLDHADEPEIANAAKDDFDRYQREGVVLLTIELFVLLGLILFSAGISTDTFREI